MNGRPRSSMKTESLRVLLVLMVIGLVAPACKPKPTTLPPVGTTQTQPQTTQPPAAGQTQQNQGQTQPRDEEPSNSPQSGGLESIATKTVGVFQLKTATRDPAAVQKVGAVDILNLVYQDSSGREVFHQISAFASNQEAGYALAGVLSNLTEQKSYTIANKADLKNNSGEIIGSEFRLTGRHTVHAWNNLRLVGIVESANESAVNDFLSDIHY